MGTAIDRVGKCYCEAVEFSVKGEVLFNGYCHCKPCTRFRGVSPVHLLGVKPSEGQSPITVTKGEEYVKIVGDQKYGSMEHAFCTECGCALFQSPKGAGFRAVFPPNFQIEDGPCAVTTPVPTDFTRQIARLC